MRFSIAAEMVLGALVVVTAAYLASLTPGTHEQPVWPLPWRPSLAAFDDADLRAELVLAACAAGIGVAIGVIGVIWRRVRWLALGTAVVIEVLATPHLDLLFVAAYPTSFFNVAHRVRRHGDRAWLTTVRRELRRLPRRRGARRWSGRAVAAVDAGRSHRGPFPSAWRWRALLVHLARHRDARWCDRDAGIRRCSVERGDLASDRLPARAQRRRRLASNRKLAAATANAAVRRAVCQWADHRSRRCARSCTAHHRGVRR